MEDDLDRIAAGALARQGMLEGFWAPFEAALGEAGGLTRKTVRAAIEDRLDAYLFGPDGAEPGSAGAARPAAATRLELKLSRYGPFVGCADYQFDWSHEYAVLSGTTTRVKAAHRTLHEAARVPPVDYRDNLHRATKGVNIARR